MKCRAIRLPGFARRPAAWLPAAATLALATAALLPACAVNPQTGRREIILMSEEKEQKVDEEAARQVAEQMGLVDAPKLVAYVDALGQELASHSLRRSIDYHFNIVEMAEPNAFALPGGHIYISRGLLEIANSEAELANVIGHEIGHVTSRHAAQRQSRATLATVFTLLGAVAAAVAGQADVAGALGQYGAVGVPALMAAYGRNQEREADAIGQDLAAQAGIDPGGMSAFLRALENNVRLQLGASHLPGFFDTHPATPERVAETASRARGIRWKPDFSIAPTRAEFLAMFDGMPLGKPASEGVLDGDRLLHPDLGIGVRFPAGWKINNARSGVIAGAPDHDAFVLLELDRSGDDPRAAALTFVKREKIRVQRAVPVMLGELRAFRVRGSAQTPQGSATAEITFVAHEGRIYRLTAAAMGVSFRKYQGSFRSFARSFRPLRGDERASIRETRLRIAVAAKGETLAELSQRTGNTWDLNRTAVANGFQLDDPLVEGQLVKVAIAEPYRSSTTGSKTDGSDPGGDPDGPDA